ncbi:30S ribosomal protein S12 methylthiotransferase RimO [Treponema sp.]|uniref:30S ribosomal protein S12 methylthiotransferase RimO n=1 Tax=Treponema sp. TaxID=166 RepID=UPI003F094A3D
MTSKKFFLDQHGCAKNQVDGELIISRLLNLGFEQVLEPEAADLIVVNSCGFIESAKKESLNSLIDARAAFPDVKILLTGCLAERYADIFKKELPEADGILGNGNLELLDSAVKSLFDGQRPVLKAEQKGVCCGERRELLSFKGSAFVKITEGCDNRCSFCAIPLIRGKLRSRNSDDIVAEIKSLLARGVFEINLIGQDLAAYGCGSDDVEFSSEKNWHEIIYRNLNSPVCKENNFSEANGESPLCSLIRKISALEGKFWVRLLYIHPDHFNQDILEVMKNDPRFLPYFDIPFQSGDDTIIRAMNRKGTSADYISLVETIRSVFPESCIRTTFLTGFPGETEASALATENFLKSIRADWSGCFPYSREEDTAADKMKRQVSAAKAKERAVRLENFQAEITAENLKLRCGKKYDVLIEEIIENKDGTDEGLAIGRAWFEAPEVDGAFVVRYDLDSEAAVKKIVPGAVVKVLAVSASGVDIDGEFAE